MIRLSLAVILSVSILPVAAQRKNEAFQNPEDDPKLPRVLLIGDSISIGYTVPVRKELEGIANVHRIPTNGGPTTRGLEQIEAWLGDGEWDVIHFNWGLHDLAYRPTGPDKKPGLDKVNGRLSTPLEDYSANLGKLVARLKKTGARLIFATTTPVPEGEPGRKLGDDLRYNEAALEVMKRHGVAIDDLHAVMAGKMDEYGTRPGNVHFTPQGYALLGAQVATSIKTALQE